MPGLPVTAQRLEKVINSTGTEVHFTLPCLSYDDFDRAGNISLWKICKLFECARVEGLRTKGFLDSGHASLYDTHMSFIVVGEFNISRSLYRRARHSKFEMPLNLLAKFLNFGRSSLTLQLQLRDPTEGFQSMAELKLLYVCVDLETRKSSPLPEWMRKKYEQYRQADNNVGAYKLMSKPNDSFVKSFTIMGSDTDRNLHTNNTTYIRLCMDTANEASLQGHLRHFQGDISQYLCKSMRVLYSAESKLGDVLGVHLWEDQQSPYVIHHQICRDDKPIFQCTIQFYAPLSKL